ncbi:hypothetical protein KAW44_00665, partial [Candidatus Bipolaricaulota bacterium]|nr:hypothetical protein [Candidatus Bipolaricaulota bacterium]
LISLHSLIDWEWCREYRRPVTWDDLVDRELKVHITISTRAWVEQELEEPTLTKDERSLYRQWLKQLEHFSFIARRAEDGVWDLIVPEDELTPAWVAEYVRTFSQATEEELDEPYEFLAEPAT